MKLGFASDHRGYLLKSNLIEYFKFKYEIIDCGTDSDNSCDYPDFAFKLGKEIVNNNINFGICICGSGIGISIACNKIKGVYCAKVDNYMEAFHTRADNDTNCIALSEKMSLDDAIKCVSTFITTDFSKLEKHIRRIDKVKQIENGTYHD